MVEVTRVTVESRHDKVDSRDGGPRVRTGTLRQEGLVIGQILGGHRRLVLTYFTSRDTSPRVGTEGKNGQRETGGYEVRVVLPRTESEVGLTRESRRVPTRTQDEWYYRNVSGRTGGMDIIVKVPVTGG